MADIANVTNSAYENRPWSSADEFGWDIDRDWDWHYPVEWNVQAEDIVGVAEAHIPDSPYYENWITLQNWYVDSNWGWQDAWIWTLGISEEFSLKDASIVFNAEKVCTEPLKVADKRIIDFTKPLKDAFKAVDAFGQTATYNRAFSERFKASDKIVKETGKVNPERLRIVDKRIVDFERPLKETVKIVDAFGRNTEFKRVFNESWSTKEQRFKDFTKSLKDSWSTSTHIKKDAEAVRKESFAFSVEDAQAAEFIRNFQESWNTSPHIIKDPSIYYYTDINFYDAMIRPANGVVSDLLFQNGVWDAEEVKQSMIRGKHVGYENFHGFLCGDYTYDKALFRVVMNADTFDRALLEQFKVDVDVPDIIDRGSLEITAKNVNTKVEFNKKFHVAPEVTITMRSGVSGEPIVPVVVTVTEKYFMMYLMNSATGERANGLLIWNAVGY